jgi:hypothetical protein
VLVPLHEIVAEAVKRGVNRTVVYRHIEQLKERLGWRQLAPSSLQVVVR